MRWAMSAATPWPVKAKGSATSPPVMVLPSEIIPTTLKRNCEASRAEGTIRNAVSTTFSAIARSARLSTGWP